MEPNWVFYDNKSSGLYNEHSAISELKNAVVEIKLKYDEYINIEYNDNIELCINYIDISYIAGLVVGLYKKSDSQNLRKIFETVEVVLCNCDSDAHELLTKGLFESIQNISESENIDYHSAFDIWLKPKSMQEWKKIITFWENDN